MHVLFFKLFQKYFAELCDVWLVAAVTLRPCVTHVLRVSAGFCLQGSVLQEA